MDTIHINRRLDSELIPELRPLIGKKVRIVAEEEQEGEVSAVKSVFKREPRPAWMSSPKSPVELSKEQGIPLRPVEEILGGWPVEETDDGFENSLKEWRQRELDEQRKRDESHSE